MSELDSELRGLRDELTAAIPLPDLERVAGHARNRRRLQLVAIAVVVVAVAVTVPLLRASRSAPPATPLDARNTSYVLDFADHDHGYALTRTCPPGASSCVFALHRSADGGRTWTPRTLPPALDPETGYTSATMYVLGPDAVAIDRPKGHDSERVYTTDGGRSWHRQQQPRQGDTSAPLADGALFTSRCAEQPYSKTGHCPDVGTIDPKTGQFVSTPTQPPLALYYRLGPSPLRNGGYWVVGATATGEAAVAITEDGGRTWSVGILPPADMWGGDLRDLEVASSDGVLYAATGGDLWTSTDDGRSWLLVPENPSERELHGFSPLMAGADGSVLVAGESESWRSTDRGRTFVKAGRGHFGVKWTRGGYLSFHSDQFALSDDGLNWREFSVR